MEAGQVVEKILAEAKAEAERISKEAEQKDAAEQAKLNEELKRYKKQTDTHAKKAGADEESHILAAARMETAKQLLAEKRTILDEVFDQARRQTAELPDDQYRRLCTRLMLEAVETGDEEVVVGKDENRIDHELIKEINRELGPGYKGNLRLSGERQNLGAGFILKRGKVKTNVSIDVLLDQARKELEIELAKELFAE
ncbi:MAG: V-type ATP synthase subunit E [Planctomycetota bacterium]|jgi:V/A-type H+-transporting ATPase subunit E